MTYDYNTLQARCKKLYPNAKIKFTGDHYTFLSSNGQRGRHLPKYRGGYYTFMSQWFESDTMSLQKRIDENNQSSLDD